MSSRTASRDRITAVVRLVVQRCGYVVEDVTVVPAGRRSVVRVLVDTTEDAEHGITLDQIAAVSRSLSDALDDEDADFGATPYVLEVSSPGLDRPLTEPRHWRRAAGRLVSVTPPGDGGADVTGRVVSSDGSGVLLLVDGTEQRLAYDAIRTARVEVEFNRRVTAEEAS